MVISLLEVQFFEHGTEGHRKELARHLIGHVLPLTLQMYGCRVIQKVCFYGFVSLSILRYDTFGCGQYNWEYTMSI